MAVLLLLFALAPPPAMAMETAGRVVLSNGDVKIGTDAGSAPKSLDPRRAVKPGDELFKSDVVSTGNGSSAKILFTDQSIMDLGPSSSLRISDYVLGDGVNRTGIFTLLYGKLRFLVSHHVGDGGHVSIATSSAVMGVRGTEFMVDAPTGKNSGDSSVVVMSGTVRVAPPTGGPGVSVGPGQMMVASTQNFSRVASASGGGRSVSSNSSSAGVVSKVSSADMSARLEEVKAPDKTFSGAVTISSSSDSGSGVVGQAVAAGNALSGSAESSSESDDSIPEGFSSPTLSPPVTLQPGATVRLTVGVR
ncbi:MAG: FecR domain-containing protein [Deltaproteobacteria bacterium]|nr:FecR domain-containing protein [Deltaproteobacteria bacterium]